MRGIVKLAFGLGVAALLLVAGHAGLTGAARSGGGLGPWAAASCAACH